MTARERPDPIDAGMARVRKPKVDKSGRTSAGILLWSIREGRLEVLLGHPGGPYFAGKDADHWTVLKGEADPRGGRAAPRGDPPGCAITGCRR